MYASKSQGEDFITNERNDYIDKFSSSNISILSESALKLYNQTISSKFYKSLFDKNLLSTIVQLIYIDEPSVYFPILETIKILLTDSDEDAKKLFCIVEGINALIWHMENRFKMWDFINSVKAKKQIPENSFQHFNIHSCETSILILLQIARVKSLNKELMTSDVLTYISNFIIHPVVDVLSLKRSSYREIIRIDLLKFSLIFLRSLSYAKDSENRIAMRNCEQLITSILSLINLIYEHSNWNSNILELSISTIRNLTYYLPEEFDPSYSIRMNQRLVEDTLCRKKRRYHFSVSDKLNQSADDNIWAKNVFSQIWDKKMVAIYLVLIRNSSSPVVLEASVGIIQNICSYDWYPGQYLRKEILQQCGLEHFYPILCSSVINVVTTTARALRNICFNAECEEKIANNGMQWIVSGLNRTLYTTNNGNGSVPHNKETFKSCAQTNSALLALAYSICHDNIGYSKLFVDYGGVGKCNHIINSYSEFCSVECEQSDEVKCYRFAKEMLKMLWKMTKLHRVYKNIGLKETDFNGKQREKKTKSNKWE